MENNQDKNPEIIDLTMVEPSQEPNIDPQPLITDKEFLSYFKPATATTFPIKKTNIKEYKKKNGTIVSAHTRKISNSGVKTGRKTVKKPAFNPIFQAPDDCPASVKLAKETKLQFTWDYLDEAKERNKNRKY